MHDEAETSSSISSHSTMVSQSLLWPTMPLSLLITLYQGNKENQDPGHVDGSLSHASSRKTSQRFQPPKATAMSQVF